MDKLEIDKLNHSAVQCKRRVKVSECTVLVCKDLNITHYVDCAEMSVW